MKMNSKSYIAGYNQAIIDNKKNVAELKKKIKKQPTKKESSFILIDRRNVLRDIKEVFE